MPQSVLQHVASCLILLQYGLDEAPLVTARLQAWAPSGMSYKGDSTEILNEGKNGVKGNEKNLGVMAVRSNTYVPMLKLLLSSPSMPSTWLFAGGPFTSSSSGYQS